MKVRIWLITTLISTIPAWAQDPSANTQLILQRLVEADKRLADWPELARYRNENARLVAPNAGEERVIFMGDSITDFWGRSEGSFFSDRRYINRGINGQTTAQMLVRFRPDVIALKPRAVVILAGTNDIAGNTGGSSNSMIEDNLASMVDLAQGNNIKVVLASLLPVNDYIQSYQTSRRPPQRILELNAWIKQFAQSRGLVYLDYYDAMLDANNALKKELSGDGLHPNAAGYAVMLPLAQRAIDQALAH